MYGMINSGRLFANEITNWLIEEVGFKNPQYQIYIYKNYTPDGYRLVVLYYVDDRVYLYTYDELREWFVDTLGKISHVKFLGYAHWFMSIRISKTKEYFISVDQARYDTSVVAKYLETTTIKEDPKFIRLPCLMIWYSLCFYHWRTHGITVYRVKHSLKSLGDITNLLLI